MATSQWSMFEEGWLSQLHKPGENSQLKPELREQHLAATGGCVQTRFPPEPNGYLHVGHSKAIAINFGYAAYHKGRCYLRFDDTNPEKEEDIYFEKILEMVRWLGFEPFRVTYSSDNFDKLYDLAVELIKRDKAFVCHQTDVEVKASRGGEKGGPRTPSPWRDRPIEESLKEFERMKDGHYKKGEATLRMKQDLEDPNPYMWDIIAYRVLEKAHPRTGSKWCIYPTYDFTHCLCDSFENISHSLCTTEFVTARQSYDWLCNALEVYRPQQSEYGRLEIQGTVLSKRRLLKLVEGGYVNGWDDPRLYTLIALRRRGVPPGAILSFISSLGVTTARAIIPLSRFEQAVRQYLEFSTPRLNLVLHPIKVVIDNLDDDHVEYVERPLHPKVPEMGKVKVPFSKVVYIDASDFKEQDEKGYFRMAPGKMVGLLNAPFPVTCTSFEKDPETGAIQAVHCTLENKPPPPSDDPDAPAPKPKKPKGWIHWVGQDPKVGSPLIIDETRIFRRLFNSEDPARLDDFLADINKDSLEIVKGAMIDIGFWTVAKNSLKEATETAQKRLQEAFANTSISDQEQEENAPSAAGGAKTPKKTVEQLVGNESVRFQGQRTAYFALDRDTKLGDLTSDAQVPQKQPDDKLVINWTVSLKEDAAKKK